MEKIRAPPFGAMCEKHTPCGEGGSEGRFVSRKGNRKILLQNCWKHFERTLILAFGGIFLPPTNFNASARVEGDKNGKNGEISFHYSELPFMPCGWRMQTSPSYHCWIQAEMD